MRLPSMSSSDRLRRLVVDSDGLDDVIAQLALPALMLRSTASPTAELVHVYVPAGPTVAFSARDARSPQFDLAVRVAREEGFTPVVRSPGGRMVAYDRGAVVIDHLVPTTIHHSKIVRTFEANAHAHARVLSTLRVADVRVGEVAGEYCPGEFSLNIAGAVKVVGSAQRITGRGSLFSTVVQVDVSGAVAAAISRVSAVLGYKLESTTVGGLNDFEPDLQVDDVLQAFAADYRLHLSLEHGDLPPHLVTTAQSAAADAPSHDAFRVDDWVRALAGRAGDRLLDM